MPAEFISTSDGCELHVERRGSGPPVVFVHGLFGLVEHWQLQVALIERRNTVLAYDLRGSGRSDKPPAEIYTIEQHALDLAEIIRRARFGEPAVLVGHSMGSCVVLELALLRPELVRGLVLVDGFSCGEHCLVGFEQMRESVMRKSTLVPLFKRVSFGKSFSWHPQGDVLSTWCADEAAKLPVEAVLASAKGFSAYDARERLWQIAVPSLVVVGDEDWSCPLDPSSRFLADNITSARLEVLHSGHLPMLEAAPRFNELLMQFVDDCT